MLSARAESLTHFRGVPPMFEVSGMSSPQSLRRGSWCPPQEANCSRGVMEAVSAQNGSQVNAEQLLDLPGATATALSITPAKFTSTNFTSSMYITGNQKKEREDYKAGTTDELLQKKQQLKAATVVLQGPHAYPTADVPDHAHYIIGSVILVVGITGMLGNFLVIYAFGRSRSLRTPANMFIINLAITDFLMSVTQAPIFFTTSLHKRWIFGEKGCELYAFCGALFGITSMITLMVIAVDRYFVITRPLASIGRMSRKRAVIILVGVWLYSLSWSLPPFFGWSAYVPEGLLTSCTWDYMTFTPSVRAYTMLLFCFVFFIPLFIIMYCYFFIFKAIKDTNKAVHTIGANDHKTSQKELQKMKKEWKMAKIALIVILLYVISWSPYSVVALMAFAGYSHMLTPYMNSVPAVIAKASAIHNPIIYAITHPKYRMALAKYIPCLGSLLRVSRKDSRSFSSYPSTRRSTMTSQTSEAGGLHRGKSRLNSITDSESGWTDIEAEIISVTSRPASRQVSYEICKDTSDTIDTINICKLKSHDSGIFEKTSMDVEDVSSIEVGGMEHHSPLATGKSVNGVGLRKGGSSRRLQAARIPSIVVTSSTLYAHQQPAEHSSSPLLGSRYGHHDNEVTHVQRDSLPQEAPIANISSGILPSLETDAFLEELLSEDQPCSELSTIL